MIKIRSVSSVSSSSFSQISIEIFATFNYSFYLCHWFGEKWQCSKCGAEIFNATHIPYKKKDAFAKLDAILSEEDKEKMTKGDSCEFHFSLGMWIRNNWIYEQDEEYVKHLAEMFGDDSLFFQPDDLSDKIIRSYQRHLRGIKRKKV